MALKANAMSIMSSFDSPIPHITPEQGEILLSFIISTVFTLSSYVCVVTTSP